MNAVYIQNLAGILRKLSVCHCPVARHSGMVLSGTNFTPRSALFRGANSWTLGDPAGSTSFLHSYFFFGGIQTCVNLAYAAAAKEASSFAVKKTQPIQRLPR